MQRYPGDLKKDVPLVSLSACQFVVPHVGKGSQNTATEAVDDGFNVEGPHSVSEPVHDMRTLDELFSVLSDELVDAAGREFGFLSNAKGRSKTLLLAWITAQFRAINAMAGVEPTSLVVGPTTFLCFKWTSTNCGFDGERWTSETDFSGDTRIMSESVNDVLYVLNVTGDSLLGQKYTAYELSVAGDEMKSVNDDLRIFLENMSLGGFMSYDTSREHVFSLIPASTFSSLGWMGTAASDVINSRYFFILYSSCGRLPCTYRSFFTFLDPPLSMMSNHLIIKFDFFSSTLPKKGLISQVLSLVLIILSSWRALASLDSMSLV